MSDSYLKYMFFEMIGKDETSCGIMLLKKEDTFTVDMQAIN